VQDRFFETTLGEVGVEVDIAATIEQAGAPGHRGTLRKRLRETWRARRGEIDVPLVWAVREAKARAYLGRIAPLVVRAPVDARLDLAARAKIYEQTGRVLDIDATLRALGEGKHDDEETIDLVVQTVPAKVTWLDLTRVEVDRVVSSFETTFSLFGTGAGRAVNIKRAASKIDGVVLMRGSVLSFNEQVGPRTTENGFTLAPEIQGDELRPGIGGGTCQAASTLHAAALFGALRIVDRQSHSRPSSYMRMGLDATVSFPLVDLKIENTLPYPVMIHAFLPNPTTIRVEILGGEPIAKVEYAYGVGETEDFVRRITVKSFLEPGRRIRQQKGSRGYDVTSFVRVLYHDGRLEQRHYFSDYRPAPEVFWVAPGYDEAELPPLPQHAKGVEGRLADTHDEREPDLYPM
jgi:vancomycin resistance protein YoaR